MAIGKRESTLFVKCEIRITYQSRVIIKKVQLDDYSALSLLNNDFHCCILDKNTNGGSR